MTIVVIGLGSMGKRRIRLIKELYPDYLIVGVDGREDRRKEAENQFSIVCYSAISELKDNVKIAFICTSPLSHSTLIKSCLEREWHVFTEINLVSEGYDENMNLAKAKNKILFLSSTFLYREEIKFIRSQISFERKWNYIYHVGQYLPDWHPWERLNDFFVSDKRTNGCREILAIELPWIISVFGEIVDLHTVSNNLSQLNLTFNDNYIIQITHKNGNKGVLIVDVVCPVAVRKFEAYTEHAYLTWNGTPDSVYAYDYETNQLLNVALTEEVEHIAGYKSFIVENAYRNEIREFFEVVEHGKKPQYGFDQDKHVLEIIDLMGA